MPAFKPQSWTLVRPNVFVKAEKEEEEQEKTAEDLDDTAAADLEDLRRSKDSCSELGSDFLENSSKETSKSYHCIEMLYNNYYSGFEIHIPDTDRIHSDYRIDLYKQL